MELFPNPPIGTAHRVQVSIQPEVHDRATWSEECSVECVLPLVMSLERFPDERRRR